MSDLSIDSERFSFLKSYLERQSSSKSKLTLEDLLEDSEIAPSTPSPMMVVGADEKQPDVEVNMSPFVARRGAKHVLPSESPAGRRSGLEIAAMSPIPDDDAAGFGGEGKRRRKIQWTQTEDVTILAAAQRLGSQWARISAHLPGRTADAVRNRYHRLQTSHFVTSEEGRSVIDGALAATGLLPAELLSADGGSTATAAASAASSALDEPAAKRGADYGRSHWTADEDRKIEEGVATHGCKWRKIAEQLPGRSDSSIRNRWVRLQQQAAAGLALLASPRQSPRTPTGGASPTPSLFACATPASAASSSATPMADGASAWHSFGAAQGAAQGQDTNAAATPTPLAPIAALYGLGKDLVGFAAASESPGTNAEAQPELGDKAISEALAALAGTDDSSELPLGLAEHPEMMIDLGAFYDAVHSLQEESARDSARDSAREAEEEAGPPADHSAPAGVRLASAFLATFAALAIGKLARGNR